MAHDHHERLPGYHPDQILVSGCRECEARGADIGLAISNLDRPTFQRAWQRAADWNAHGLPSISTAELPLLRVLVQVQAQRDELADLRGIVADQGDVKECGCGWPVTEYDGAWVHVYNDYLTGTDDHDPDPT
jgi:hypothetical protein